MAKANHKEVKFSSQKKVTGAHDDMEEFIGKIFNFDLDSIFVSDESTLEDFEGVLENGGDLNSMIKKIKKVYGIDVSDVKHKPIVEIVSFINKK